MLRRWRRRRRSSDKPSGLPLDHYYGNCSTVSCTSWTWWNATSGTDGICTKVPSSSQVRNCSVELRFSQLRSCDELRFFVSVVRKCGNGTVKTGCWSDFLCMGVLWVRLFLLYPWIEVWEICVTLSWTKVYEILWFVKHFVYGWGFLQYTQCQAYIISPNCEGL